MRILTAFFGVIFMFINPVMLLRVVKEVENVFTKVVPEHLRLELIEFVRDLVTNKWQIVDALKVAIPCIVTAMTLLHLVVTCLTLYGIYSCRPAFIRPMLIDAAFSLFVLFCFVTFSMYLHFRLNSYYMRKDEDIKRSHIRNLYVGAAFLLTYFIWLCITIVGYFDVRRLHADFMYWIVEERQSMRRESLHYDSIEKRSDRSSKSSKGSKNSTRSSKTKDETRPSSATGSVKSKPRTSLAHNRLSVPL